MASSVDAKTPINQTQEKAIFSTPSYKITHYFRETRSFTCLFTMSFDLRVWEEYIQTEPAVARQKDYYISIANNGSNIQVEEEVLNCQEPDQEDEDEGVLRARAWFYCDLCKKRTPLPREEHDDNAGHMTLVQPGLYLGAAWNACNEIELSAAKIRVVVSMAAELSKKLFPNTIEYRHYALEDDCYREFIIPQLVDVARFIALKTASESPADAPVAVLVHCAMGKSRSVSAIIAYLLHSGGGKMSANRALFQIRTKRPFAQPNSGYMHQLEALEILYRALSPPLVQLVALYCPQNGFNQ
jgi:protein-tyrosine phosphatase